MNVQVNGKSLGLNAQQLAVVQVEFDIVDALYDAGDVPDGWFYLSDETLDEMITESEGMDHGDTE